MPMPFLIFLWLVPVAALLLSRRLAPSFLWRITGVCFGAVVSPASLGLYSLYFVGPAAALFVLGMLGLLLMLLHGTPGYYLAILLGFVPAGTVVDGRLNMYIELPNAIIWGTAYGSLGWVIDLIRNRRANNSGGARAA